MSDSSGSNINAFLIGLIIGGALGVFFAPDKGEETRRKFKENYKEWSKKALEEAEELQEAHDRAVRSLEDVQTAYGEQKACVERLREGLNRKQKVLAAAERTVRWLQLSEQLADLSKRLGRAQGLRRQVEQAQRELGKLVAPDQRELGSLTWQR